MNKHWISLILGIAILGLILLFVDGKEVAEQLQSMGFEWIIVALVLTFISILLKSIRWVKMLQARGITLSIKNSLLIVSASNFLFLFMPNVASDLYRAYAVKKTQNEDYTTVLSSAVFEKLLNFVAVFSLGGIWFVGYLFLGNNHVQDSLIIGMVGILSLLLLLIYAIRNPDYVFFVYGKIKQAKPAWVESRIGLFLRKHGGAALGEMKALSTNKMLLVETMALTFLAWIAQGLRMYAVALGLGASISFISLLGVYFLAVGIGALTMLPGSIGSQDSLLLVLLVLIGVDRNLGFSLIVAERIVFILACIGCAGVFYYLNTTLHFSNKKLEEVKRSE